MFYSCPRRIEKNRGQVRIIVHGEEGGKTFLLIDIHGVWGTVDTSATCIAPQWLMCKCL